MSATGGSADNPRPIDPAALANLKEIGGGDASFVVELITMFGEDSPPRLEGIATALVAGDAAELAKNAHSLKGTGSNFGADQFRSLAQAIETAGKEGDISGVPPLLEELKSEFVRVKQALDEAAAAGI
jgi:HPt (histidine-containing phosphotransfer) domain-containing protein